MLLSNKKKILTTPIIQNQNIQKWSLPVWENNPEIKKANLLFFLPFNSIKSIREKGFRVLQFGFTLPLLLSLSLFHTHTFMLISMCNLRNVYMQLLSKNCLLTRHATQLVLF